MVINNTNAVAVRIQAVLARLMATSASCANAVEGIRQKPDVNDSTQAILFIDSSVVFVFLTSKPISQPIQ